MLFLNTSTHAVILTQGPGAAERQLARLLEFFGVRHQFVGVGELAPQLASRGQPRPDELRSRGGVEPRTLRVRVGQ